MIAIRILDSNGNNVDIPLERPTKQVVEFLSKYIDPNLATPWEYRSWPGFGMAGVTIPTGFSIPSDIRINRFVWPLGASRWAYMFCLCDAESLNSIANYAFGSDGTKQIEVNLVLDSPDSFGKTERVITEMYMLPPKPLSSVVPKIMPSGVNDIVNTNNLYLLTLVDERYFWWFANVGDLSTIVDIDSGVSWSTLISNITNIITTRFGTGFTNSTILATYLNASHAFILPYEDFPLILDAIAYNIGMRVVRKFDGSVKLQSFADADTAISNNFRDNPGRSIIAGGESLIDRVKYF